MNRYIKVNNQWIDTLEEQKQYGRYYWINKGIVYYTEDEYLQDYKVGKLQGESDEVFKNNPYDFLNLYPKGSYNKYCEWCTDKPISKKKFRGVKKTYETVAL